MSDTLCVMFDEWRFMHLCYVCWYKNIDSLNWKCYNIPYGWLSTHFWKLKKFFVNLRPILQYCASTRYFLYEILLTTSIVYYKTDHNFEQSFVSIATSCNHGISCNQKLVLQKKTDIDLLYYPTVFEMIGYLVE